MAKGIVLVKEKRLIGVYSNKNNMWKVLSNIEGAEDTLLIKTSETTILNCSYSNMVRYLKQRIMLKLYSKQEYNDGVNIEELKPIYRIWETIINQNLPERL